MKRSKPIRITESMLTSIIRETIDDLDITQSDLDNAKQNNAMQDYAYSSEAIRQIGVIYQQAIQLMKCNGLDAEGCHAVGDYLKTLALNAKREILKERGLIR